MTRPFFLVFLILTCAAVSAASACQRRPSTAVIGLAESLEHQVRVAVEQINALNERGGTQIKLVERAIVVQQESIGLEVERANYLIKYPDMIGVIGHLDSRSSLMTAPIYNEARIPQLVPTATSQMLKRAGPWTFMLSPDDAIEGAFIGDFVADTLKARTVSIFFQLDEYGRGLRDGVLARLREKGVVIVDQTPFDWMHDGGESPEFDFGSLVAASMKRGIPDVVVIAGRRREAAEIIRLFHARAPDVRFVAGDAVLPEKRFLEPIRHAAGKCYLVAFWRPEYGDEVSRAYYEKFRKLNGMEPSSGDAITHDAIMLLADAIRTAGPDREAVRRYLNELGSVRPAYHGVTGKISFDKGRENRLFMTEIRDGLAVRVITNQTR